MPEAIDRARPGGRAGAVLRRLRLRHAGGPGSNWVDGGDRPAASLSAVARNAADLPPESGLLVVNPDDEVTPEAFAAWLDRRQAGEPISLSVSAADTLAEIRSRRY